MTTENDLAAVPAGPPWSLDVIADLHAGVYSPEVAAELRARITGDRDAQAMLSALGSVVDELSLLPPMRMPEGYASRLDSVIAQESAARSQRMAAVPGRLGQAGPPGAPGQQSGPGWQSGPSPTAGGQPAGPGQQSGPSGPPTGQQPVPPRPFLSVVPGQPTGGPSGPQESTGPTMAGSAPNNVHSLDAARRRRRGVITGLGIAAAVAAIATVTISLSASKNPGLATQPGATAAAPAPSSVAPNAVEIDPGKVGDAYAQINGNKQASLTNGITYTSCLAANGIKGNDVLGAVNASYQGKPVLAIAVAVDATHADIYIVGSGCGPAGAQLIAKQQVSR